MSVINHDFGGDKRRATRRFRSLLKLDALHEANIEANPLPYLERASDRIFQLEKTIFEALLAAQSVPAGDTPAMVTITADEYQRMRACIAILETAQAELNAADDEDE